MSGVDYDYGGESVPGLRYKPTAVQKRVIFYIYGNASLQVC